MGSNVKRALIRVNLYPYIQMLLSIINGKRADIKNKSNKIFFLLTPTYGNLGDQAIEYATEQYLNKFYSEYLVINISLHDIYRKLYYIDKTIKKNDLIVIQGGGNFGNLYMECEYARRFIVRHYKSNRIIVFPSTVSYTDSRRGVRALRIDEKLFNRHKDLTIISRERYSYDFSKEHFYCCNNLLCPDIAFLLNRRIVKDNREGVLVCLRQDKESVILSERERIIKSLKEKIGSIKVYDTQIGREVTDNSRKNELEKAFNLFSSVKCVVTDRLHGMIFSVITGTPCVVFPSIDNKIRGSYEWIKSTDAVILCEIKDIERIPEVVRGMESKRFNDLDFEKSYFELLRGCIERKNSEE